MFDYRDERQHASNDELAIGTSTRLLLEEYSDDVEGTTTERKFFTAVRSFYQEVVAKMLSKFPFQDLTIRDLAILNPASRSTISTASVLRLSKRFTSLTSPNDINDLECEVRDYKSMAANQLPTVSSGPSSNLTIDHFWADPADMRKITDTEEKRFTYPPALCKRLLVLPHSTADPERVFSMVKKVETDHRGSLLPATIRSLLHVKLNSDESCHESQFSSKLLQTAKTATDRKVNSAKP